MAITAIATGESSSNTNRPPSPPSSKIAAPPVGDLKVGTLQVAGASTLTGATTQTGALALASTLSVAGAATLSAAATVGTTLGVTGVETPTGGIASAGGFSTVPYGIHTGAVAPTASTSGTDATPVATEVYFAQVFIPDNMTITGIANFNGSVASGNVKVGLANSAGVVVATSASTAMSGTDAYQRIVFTTPYAAKGPATYYVLLFVDNNTARVNCHPFGNFVAGKQTGQVYATGFTTITPGTSFTADLGPMASLY